MKLTAVPVLALLAGAALPLPATAEPAAAPATPAAPQQTEKKPDTPQPAKSAPSEKSAPSDQEQGVEHFYNAAIGKALAAWDRHLAANPADRSYHWQRGLALYYAGRWADGQQQFEEHQKVNPADVENAAWHFLCVARAKSPDEAKKRLIPIAGDTRVPMAQIHDLFAGKGTEEAVLAAAEAHDTARSSTNARCYAHLYLGLYHEALGDPAKAKTHMLKAAHDYRQMHYMGRTAQVHCQLRGWKP